jgi:hypothetical protein
VKGFLACREKLENIGVACNLIDSFMEKDEGFGQTMLGCSCLFEEGKK